MAYVLAAPGFYRQGVIAGFTLGVPAAGAAPTITKGVLRAQGSLYRPAAAPVLPAAPEGRSYLFYGTGAFYWSADWSNVVGDAYLGWVVVAGGQVVLTSSQRIEIGEDADASGARVVELGPAQSPVLPPDADPGPAPELQAVSTALPYYERRNDGWYFGMEGVVVLPADVSNVQSVGIYLHWIEGFDAAGDPIYDSRYLGIEEVRATTGGAAIGWRTQSQWFVYTNGQQCDVVLVPRNKWGIEADKATAQAIRCTVLIPGSDPLTPPGGANPQKPTAKADLKKKAPAARAEPKRKRA
jgi:hypothetical protein